MSAYDDGPTVTLADRDVNHKVVHLKPHEKGLMDVHDSLLQQLRNDLAGRRCSTVAIRAKIIEALGDKICGSGDGPAPDDLAAFVHAEDQENLSAARLRAHLGNLADRVIQKVRDPSA